MHNVLYSTEFGSRLYGAATPTSDLDLKYIVLPPLEKLLIGDRIKNEAHSTGDPRAKNTKDDIDVEYVPIQVFARDFLDGQTYALELAFSVFDETRCANQTVHNSLFVEFVSDLTENFLTSNVKSMTGYAYNQARIYGLKGNRLATITKFLAKLNSAIKIFTDAGVEPAKAKFLEEDWKPWIDANADKYMFCTMYENSGQYYPAMSLVEKITPFNDLPLTEVLRRAEALRLKYGNRAEAAIEAGGQDWKASMHALRITMQANQLLSSGFLTFPFSPASVEMLLAVKTGSKSPEEFKALLEEEMDRLELLKDKTSLQPISEDLFDKFKPWLAEWMIHFYKLDNLRSSPQAFSGESQLSQE